MALDRCGTRCANALCRSPNTTECRFDDGKKSECSRRKPRIKFDVNFESLSWRLWFFELFSNRFDKKLLFGLATLLLLLLFLMLVSFVLALVKLKLLLLLLLLAATGRVDCCSSCLPVELLDSGSGLWWLSDTMATWFSVVNLSTFDLSKSDADDSFLVRSFEKKRSISQSRSRIASLDEVFSELVGFSAAF